jgi:hypothetical protein
MQTSEFLRHVWPSQGIYCVVGKDQQNNISPKFVNTIEEAAEVADRLAKDKYDVYFACSSYTNPTERTKNNAKEAKALWLDIDCGFDEKKNKYKDYKTKDAALIALRKFTDELGLPEPTIVDSGRGIHCYWTFTEPVPKEVWHPVAEGLKFACVKHELHADGSVTIASSSVRDNGVRTKQVYLNADNWIIIDVPAWDVQRSIELLDHTNGHNYDMLGAMSTALLIGQRKEKWFCNEWVGHPFVPSAYILGPAQFAALCASQGRDITQEFFKERQHLVNKGP